MATTIELLDRLEEILKQTLPEDKAKEVKRIIAELSKEVAKETIEKEIPQIEENLSKRLATKEDVYKLAEEIKTVISQLQLSNEQRFSKLEKETEFRFSKLEKEILTLKLLLWFVLIFIGISAFPQLLNLLKLLK